jgi:hypothetical protein
MADQPDIVTFQNTTARGPEPKRSQRPWEETALTPLRRSGIRQTFLELALWPPVPGQGALVAPILTTLAVGFCNGKSPAPKRQGFAGTQAQPS